MHMHTSYSVFRFDIANKLQQKGSERGRWRETDDNGKIIKDIEGSSAQRRGEEAEREREVIDRRSHQN